MRTGLKDRNGDEIYEGEVILVGMREDDHRGWTEERVVRTSPWWKFWSRKYALQNPNRPEDRLMDMQRNPKLRQKLSHL